VVNRVSFSYNHLEIDEIVIHHLDTESALRSYFIYESNSDHERFIGYNSAELSEELMARIAELSHTSSLSLLAALEAVFRIDYLQRNYKKKKDLLSKALREIYKNKSTRASLEEDILEAWKIHARGSSSSRLIGELKGAYKYRHWLAHGRYWQPKMGRPNYDYDSIYLLALTVLNSFPFEGLDT
jgi:hypothetical protein